MIAKLPPELVHELEQVGDQPLPVENPSTHRVYVLVDTERYEVVRRASQPSTEAGNWTDEQNERRCALIHKKFSVGISDDEAGELLLLQVAISSHRRRVVPLPYDVINELQAALNSTRVPPVLPPS